MDFLLGRLCLAAFGRVSEADGFSFWRVNIGVREFKTIADESTMTPEYKERVAAQTTDEIITGFYENVLGRGPDQEGLDFWFNEISAGSTTSDGLLLRFANSDENIDRFNPLLV